ncbi:MAG: prenyltransferase, partial [Minisyncoccia bacterium]
IIGFVGMMTIITYSLPKIGLASIGLGEVSVGLVFGPLMTLGAYYVQTGAFSWVPIVASIPIAGLIALILFINEFPDYKADKSVGKRTLVVRIGLEKSLKTYLIFAGVIFLIIVWTVTRGFLPVQTISTLVAFPFVVWAWNIARVNLNDPKSLTPSLASTAIAHLVAGLAIISAYLSTYFGYMPVGIMLYFIVVCVGLWFAKYIKNKSDAFTKAKQTFVA